MSKRVYFQQQHLHSTAWPISGLSGSAHREHRLAQKAGIYEEEGCDQRKWEGLTREHGAQKGPRRPLDADKPSSATTEEA